VADVEICWPSGAAANTTETANCHRKFTALTIGGAVPLTLPETPEGTGQTYKMEWLENKDGQRADRSCFDGELIYKSAHVWPRLVEPWVSAKNRRTSILPVWDAACQREGYLTEGSMIIAGIQNGSTIKSAAVGDELPEIPLRAMGGVGSIRWYLNGELAGATYANSSSTYKIKSRGQYQLIAIDEELSSAMTLFYVD
jgi:penicillin-binding protein 1C